MLDVSFVVESKQPMAQLTRLEERLMPSALSIFLEGPVLSLIQDRARARFQGEGDDVVGKWAALKPVTIAIRTGKNIPAGPINKRTGQLEQYVTNSPSLNMQDAEGATLVNPGVTPVGSLLDKVITAQSGWNSPRTVPRPVIGVNEKDMAATMTALERYIMRG